MNPARSKFAVSRIGRALPLLVIAVIAAIQIPMASRGLNEHHGFRQSQTALTALEYHQHGVNLLHSPLPILGKGDVPLEFPVFQAISAAVMSWGVSPDIAVRSTGLFFFIVSCALLYQLARQMFNSRVALLALVLYGFCPYMLQWGHAALIESMANSAGIGWALCALLWIRKKQPVYLLLAIVLGVLAFTIKITTATGWVLLVIAIVIGNGQANLDSFKGSLRRTSVLLAGVIGLPAIAGVAWTEYAQNIRSNDPETLFLTGKVFQKWNFGTLSQRLTPSNWTVIIDRLAPITCELIGAIFFVACLCILVYRRSNFTLGLMAATAAPVIVFFNLFVVHDYYLMAITPQICILVAFATVEVIGGISSNLKRPAILALALLAVITQMEFLFYWHQAPFPVPTQSTELIANTSPTDRVVMDGYDWNPLIPYYARRSAWMLRDDMHTPAMLQRFGDKPFQALLFRAPSSDLLKVLQNKQTVATVAPDLLVTDTRLAQSAQAVMTSTAETNATTGNSTTLKCNAQTMLPAGKYLVSGGSDQWIKLSSTLAPLPIRTELTLRNDFPAATCTGGDAIILTAIK